MLPIEVDSIIVYSPPKVALKVNETVLNDQSHKKSLISAKKFDQEMNDGSLVWNLDKKESPEGIVPLFQHSPEGPTLLDPTQDDFSKDLPDCSHHTFDLVPEVTPLSHCQSDPINMRSCMDKFLSSLKSGLA